MSKTSAVRSARLIDFKRSMHIVVSLLACSRNRRGASEAFGAVCANLTVENGVTS